MGGRHFSETHGHQVDEMMAETSLRRDRWWTVGVWVLLAACVAGSLASAGAWQSYVEAQAHHNFQSRAADLSATLQSVLQRDTDFIASLGTFVATNPNATTAQFVQEVNAVDPLHRYPGGIGYLYIKQVPAAELSTFEKSIVGDPPSPYGTPVTRYDLIPPGARPSYCLPRLSVPMSAQATAAFGALAAGVDYCAVDVLGAGSKESFQATTDTNQFSVGVLGKYSPGVFAIMAPVYRSGSAPTTVSERRSALVGWVAGTFNGAALGGVAPAGQRGLWTQVTHQNPGSEPVVVVQSGSKPTSKAFSQTIKVEADGEWAVQVQGSSNAGTLSARLQAAGVLLAGLLLSGLLFGFVHVLARSRRHALRLVEERTGELRHLALHDALTGLANRKLILDRLEQMVGRARRQGRMVAVLFIDLDGFKDVNDTFGHAAGDALLRSVAAHLSSSLRVGDTAGRLGGDEFVVLAESTLLDNGVEAIGQRLLGALRETFRLNDAAGTEIAVHASIGIAVGDSSPDELLRDADIALYRAKGGGKNQYVLFDSEMLPAARPALDGVTPANTLTTPPLALSPQAMSPQSPAPA